MDKILKESTESTPSIKFYANGNFFKERIKNLFEIIPS